MAKLTEFERKMADTLKEIRESGEDLMGKDEVNYYMKEEIAVMAMEQEKEILKNTEKYIISYVRDPEKLEFLGYVDVTEPISRYDGPLIERIARRLHKGGCNPILFKNEKGQYFLCRHKRKITLKTCSRKLLNTKNNK